MHISFQDFSVVFALKARVDKRKFHEILNVQTCNCYDTTLINFIVHAYVKRD